MGRIMQSIESGRQAYGPGAPARGTATSFNEAAERGAQQVKSNRGDILVGLQDLAAGSEQVDWSLLCDTYPELALRAPATVMVTSSFVQALIKEYGG